MSPADDIYFALPGGDPSTLISFNTFGNIWYGFMGAAAGFASGTLLGFAGLFDAARNQFNLEDLAAVQKGIELWEKYGYDLKPEHIHEAILDLVRRGQVHTRRSRGGGGADAD